MESATPSKPPVSDKPSRRAGAFLADYRPIPGAHDELFESTGELRPQWRRLFEFLQNQKPGNLRLRWERAEQMLIENGINYNVFAESEERSRPWSLDPLPFIMTIEEWQALEAGLRQRARLLNLILKDIYGPQTLLRDGALPAALVVGNPHFLRACHGIEPPRDAYLHFLAIDLARSPDGRWWVLDDQTQAPAGAGFALENRIVVGSTLTELYRDCQVFRHAPFFQEMHQNLVNIAPREDPHIVLLTPGPAHETYFEHSYLARYLGFSLVEGADLMVRDDRIYLKTLGGLQQVDVIVRHLLDDDCDPLELRSESLLGVTGLVQAVRAGHVVVANALGSGVVQSNALLAFMPSLCRRLLGTDLKIPNVGTWWCGQADVAKQVLERFDELLFKKAFDSRSKRANEAEPVLGSEVSLAIKERMRRDILRNGHEYVAQEAVLPSTVPSFSEGNLVPRPFVLRAYLAAKDDDFVVLPGGLAHLLPMQETRAIPMNRGGDVKDTWVLSPTPVEMVSLLATPEELAPLRRTGRDLPSRAADNLYWLGRYAERTEGTLRMLRSLVKRLSVDSGVTSMPVIQRLLDILVEYGQVSPPDAEAAAAGRQEPLEQALGKMLYDPSYPNGVHEILRNLLRAASLVRDRLSVDAWMTLNRLRQDRGLRLPHRSVELGATLNILNDQIHTLSAFAGMEMENMTRSYGWAFLDLGRRMERAQHMVEVLKTTLLSSEKHEAGVLDVLLELADSFMTYRSRYLAPPHIAPVLDLILVDESNPRSVGFQMAAIERHIDALPREPDQPSLSKKQRMIKQVRTQLQVADIEQLIATDENDRYTELARMLNALAAVLPALSERIAQVYFSHAEAARPAHVLRAGRAP